MLAKAIIFTAPGIAELNDIEVGKPSHGQVLVNTVISSISSGTERANLVGDPNVSILRSTAGKPASFPRRVGYSSSGTVIEVGEGVKGLEVGDRVALAGGTHASIQCMTQDRLIKLNDGITFSDAALAYIATFPIAAVRKTHIEIGESAAVMGLGVLGMFAVQLLRAAGAYPVIAVDPVECKREKALALGADYALDPTEPDFTEKMLALTHGGLNVAIEVTGNGHALDQVLDCMARLGRVALLGCTRDPNFTIDYYRKVHGPGINLIGAHNNARPSLESSPGLWTTRDDINALLGLRLGGRIVMGGMVEAVHSPSEAPDVFTRLMNDREFPITQFDWTTI